MLFSDEGQTPAVNTSNKKVREDADTNCVEKPASSSMCSSGVGVGAMGARCWSDACTAGETAGAGAGAGDGAGAAAAAAALLSRGRLTGAFVLGAGSLVFAAGGRPSSCALMSATVV